MRKIRRCGRKETVNESGSNALRLLASSGAARDAVRKAGLDVGIAAYVVLTVGIFTTLGVVQKLVERL